jgi:hypothetical protein
MNSLRNHIRKANFVGVSKAFRSASACTIRRENSISGSPCMKFNNNFIYVNKRSITSNSWAADKLEAKGKF